MQYYELRYKDKKGDLPKYFGIFSKKENADSMKATFLASGMAWVEIVPCKQGSNKWYDDNPDKVVDI